MLSSYNWCNVFQQSYRFRANIHRLQVQAAVSNNNTESTLTGVRFCLFNSKLGQCTVRHDSSTFRWDRMSVLSLTVAFNTGVAARSRWHVVWQTSFSFTCPSPEGPSPLATSDPFLLEKQDDNQYLITADSAPRV
jgi:hypothetical protein